MQCAVPLRRSRPPRCLLARAVRGALTLPRRRAAAAADEQLAARDLSRADPELQKRFGKGTRYHLKARRPRRNGAQRRCLRSCAAPQVVLRGDIGTGKSAMLKRLRGGGYTPAYEPRHAACTPAALFA
jgi:hypothetical protein